MVLIEDRVEMLSGSVDVPWFVHHRRATKTGTFSPPFGEITDLRKVRRVGPVPVARGLPVGIGQVGLTVCLGVLIVGGLAFRWSAWFARVRGLRFRAIEGGVENS